MTHVVERDDDVTAEEDNLERSRRAIAHLRSLSFLPPGQRRQPRTPIEWDPDPLVRARRAVERLRAIRF
jgi:hypothetical protein